MSKLSRIPDTAVLDRSGLKKRSCEWKYRPRSLDLSPKKGAALLDEHWDAVPDPSVARHGGYVWLSGGSIAVGIGYTWEHGTLYYSKDQKQYHFKLSGISIVGHLIMYHAFVVSVTIVALVIVLRQGEVLAELLSRHVDEKFGRLGARFVDVAIAALRATVQSMVLVGLIDGIAVGIIYSMAHIPSPVEWAAVTGMLAMLPFIGYFAVAAVCMTQIAHDASGSALIVGAVGFSLLFLCDKFIRPMLMAKGARLNFLGALMGTVGGLQSFGLLGIFLGPVIVAVGKAIFVEWLTHAGAESN
jgi:predicted PurR-regulated permease PerM